MVDARQKKKKICLPSRDQVNLDIRSDLDLVSTLEVPESIESAASFINGAVLVVDGGHWLAGNRLVWVRPEPLLSAAEAKILLAQRYLATKQSATHLGA